MAFAELLAKWTSNSRLQAWILEAIALCQPQDVHLCDGSLQEYQSLCSLLVQKGTFIPLKRPGSFLCRSDPSDVARVEEATFICSRSKEDAGPTNNWRDPEEMLALLKELFTGCMRGKTLYVIPFCMGPTDSPFSLLGVEITDSAYVACSMHLMTRMGAAVLKRLEKESFIPCMHSVGAPLVDTPWPCNPKQKYIVHFPEDLTIWSFGSGYGGNALLGKKSFALRIASVMARDQRWHAEHMLIMGLTNPKGVKKYIAAAFPSGCGKTNLALLSSSLPGWKVECVGDDIAWMHVDTNGVLRAINPEAGFFGVAPGTSIKSNPHAMATISRNTLFTNVALTDEGDVWWEGMTKTPPAHLIDWQGNDWTPESKTPAAHPNSRFTVSIEQCPILDPAWNDPEGVPIAALLFGGRRSSTIPLVYEALSWEHGILVGATLSSETTAAAKGVTGKLRHDPFAMLPFCGYNMGDYFAHWLNAHARLRIFHVNWFLKDAQGKYLWPGFGDNIRVLKWIFERICNETEAITAPIGYLPSSLDTFGLNLDEALMRVDTEAWKKEVQDIQSYFQLFGGHLPQALKNELDALNKRLDKKP